MAMLFQEYKPDYKYIQTQYKLYLIFKMLWPVNCTFFTSKYHQEGIVVVAVHFILFIQKNRVIECSNLTVKSKGNLPNVHNKRPDLDRI